MSNFGIRTNAELVFDRNDGRYGDADCRWGGGGEGTPPVKWMLQSVVPYILPQFFGELFASCRIRHRWKGKSFRISRNTVVIIILLFFFQFPNVAKSQKACRDMFTLTPGKEKKTHVVDPCTLDSAVSVDSGVELTLEGTVTSAPWIQVEKVNSGRFFNSRNVQVLQQQYDPQRVQ